MDFSGHCRPIEFNNFKEYLRKLQGKIERSRGTPRRGGESAARAEQERKAREEAERKAREAERQRQEQERLRMEAAARAERERRARQEAERRAREAEEARQKQMALNNLRQNWLSDGSLKSQYLIELLKSLRFSPNGDYTTFQNIKSKVENTVQSILKGYSQKLRIIVGTPLYQLSGKFGEICTGRDLLSVEGVSMPKHIAQILDVPSALLQDTEILKVIQSECNQAIKTIDMELYNKDNLPEDEQKEFFEVINRGHLEFRLKFGNISSSNINTTLPIFFSLMLANLQKENAGIAAQIAQKKGAGKAQNQAQRILKTLQKQVNFGNKWENLQKTFSGHPALATAGINGAALGNITREQMISAINLVVSDSMLDSLPTPNLVESILNPGYEYRQKDKIFDSPQHDELNRYISELIANKGTKLATMLRATMSGKAHAVYDRAGQEDEATARTLYTLREQIGDILQENLIPMGFGLPKIIEWEGDFLLVQELQQLISCGEKNLAQIGTRLQGLLRFWVKAIKFRIII